MSETKKNKNSKSEFQFKDWFRSIFKKGTSLNGEDIEYISQMDENRFLFSWNKTFTALNHKFAIYDKSKNKFSKLPDGILKKDQFIDIIRYDSDIKSYFVKDDFSSYIAFIPVSKKIKYLSFYEPKGAEDIAPDLQEGLEILSFIVDKDNFYLIAFDKLYVIRKRFLLKEIDKDESGDENIVSISLSKTKKDVRQVKLIEPIDKDKFRKLDCQFDDQFIYLILNKDDYGIHFTKVLRINVITFEQKVFYLPVFSGMYVSSLIEYYESDSDKFKQYLLLFNLLYSNPEADNIKNTPVFLFPDRLICNSNVSYKFNLDDLKIKEITQFPNDVDIYYYLLYSDDISEKQNGIIDYLTIEISIDETDMEYLYSNHNEIFLDALEKEMDKGNDTFICYSLDNYVSYLSYFPNRFELASQFLEGNKKRQYIGLSLYKGRVKRKEIIDELDDNYGLPKYSLNNTSVLFESSKDIPIEKIMAVINKAIKYHITVENIEINDNNSYEPMVNKYLLEKSIEVIASWDIKESEQIIRSLQKKKINILDKVIADEIGKFHIDSLKDLLIIYLDYENTDVIRNALSSMESLRVPGYEEKINSFLGNMDEYVVHSAASALDYLGSYKSISKLLYSYIISCYLSEENDIIYLYEDSALEYIFERELYDPLEDNEVVDKSNAKKVSTISNFLLAYLWLAITFNDDSFKSAVKDDGRELDEMLNILERYSTFPEIHKYFNKSVIKKLISKGYAKEKQIVNILEWLINSKVTGDSIYLIGLGLIFGKNYLNFRKNNKNIEAIVIYLARIFKDMYNRNNDFRKLIAALTLLELGVDRKWERIVLEYFENDEWFGWIRLSKMAAKVLEYLPPEKKVNIIVTIIENTTDNVSKIDEFEKLVNIDVQFAVKKYEEGIIKLNKIREALLYGKNNDYRGLNVVKENFQKYPMNDLVDYLIQEGSENSIQFIKDQIKKKESFPPDFIDYVNKALSQIKK